MGWGCWWRMWQDKEEKVLYGRNSVGLVVKMLQEVASIAF